MRSLPNILPLLKFQNLEMFPAVTAFPAFLGKKKRGKFGKKIARQEQPLAAVYHNTVATPNAKGMFSVNPSVV